jgi:hypothetical protein
VNATSFMGFQQYSTAQFACSWNDVAGGYTVGEGFEWIAFGY